MAIVWSNIVGGYGRIGIETSVANTNDTTATVTANIYIWTKYSCYDSSNTLYFDNNTTSASTSYGSFSISTTVETGSGWSTSNQKLLKTVTFTKTRGTSASTQSCAAKLTNVDRVGGTMTVTASYTIPVKTKYTISYNLNGGTGTSSDQTKWYGTNLTLHPAPTREGWTFVGWGSSATDTTKDYAASATYTANASKSLYAIWSKSINITYNANGGSGAPSSSSGTVYNGNNRSYTISSTKPTRTNYNFLGWSTTSTASSPDSKYDPGDAVTLSNSITLYAVWELAYWKPKITNLKVSRCNSSGAADETGTYAMLSFDWECCQLISSNPIKSSTYKLGSGTATAISVDTTATSGSVSVKIGGSANADETYIVEVTVTDTENGIQTDSVTLPAAKFPIDFKAGGKGVSIMGPAVDDGVFDIYSSTRIRGNRYAMSSPGVAGTSGYVLMAEIKVIAANADTPITFVFSRRQEQSTMTVHVRLNNPASYESDGIFYAVVSTIRYEGTNYDVYLCPGDNVIESNGTYRSNVWKLYVTKGSNYDTITLQDWWTSKTMESRIDVTFPGTLLANAIPEPFYRATPAMLDSILDYIYPVDSIYMSYSHKDPNVMFGGVWERIENAFLWATTSSGNIGLTGGEKEHTLTASELPSTVWHSGSASGGIVTKFNAGTQMGINTQQTSMGKAHNNMPPYIQVSVWKRMA